MLCSVSLQSNKGTSSTSLGKICTEGVKSGLQEVYSVLMLYRVCSQHSPERLGVVAGKKSLALPDKLFVCFFKLRAWQERQEGGAWKGTKRIHVIVWGGGEVGKAPDFHNTVVSL